jgi:hypothetical protein
MTQGGREMVADRLRGIPVSEFPLTYRDKLIDEVSDVGEERAKKVLGFTHQYTLYGVQS